MDRRDVDRACPSPERRPFRIALTGGPGGGKTTAADLLRREVGNKGVIVPEAATLLYRGGFPRVEDPIARCAIQRSIYHVQRGLEDVQSALYPERVLLCDRGTVDGAAYWPASLPLDYFEAMGSSIEREYDRYDSVLFFESAAVGGNGIEGGNPIRIESIAEAAALDGRLRELWEGHPDFHLIPHDPSFIRKITRALAILQDHVDRATARDATERRSL